MRNQKTALYGILTFALTSPAYAALNCTVHPSCESLGYSKTSIANCADGGYVLCPYDTTYKKCIQRIVHSDDPCAGFDLTAKPENAKYYECQSKTGSKYEFIGCNNGYCAIDTTCHRICDTSSYPYTTSNQPANSTLTGACTGYTGSSNSACSGSSGTRYSGFSCNDGYININGNCIKAYEDCSSADYEYDSLPDGKYCETSAQITLLDGTNTTCYSSCVSAYEDCSSAGYEYDSNEDMYCETSAQIILLDGTNTTCYSDCVTAYEDCEAAGYEYDSNDSMICESSAQITLLDGTTTSCYSDCVTTYEDCSSAGYEFSGFPDGMICSTRGTIILTDGTSTSCYSDCVPNTTGDDTDTSSCRDSTECYECGLTGNDSECKECDYLCCQEQCREEYEASGCSTVGFTSCYEASARYEECSQACLNARYSSVLEQTPVMVATLSDEECINKYLSKLDNNNFVAYNTNV